MLLKSSVSRAGVWQRLSICACLEIDDDLMIAAARSLVADAVCLILFAFVRETPILKMLARWASDMALARTGLFFLCE